MENEISESLASESNGGISEPLAIDITCRNDILDPRPEANWFLAVFPIEIWLQILTKIYKPEDLYNLVGTSCFFEELLETSKTKLLFPKVIKIFTTKCPLASKEIRRVLMKCRLVCRTWEIGVNSVLNSFLKMKVDTFFQNTETIHAFLQHFDESYATKTRNPFLSRNVSINFDKRRNEVFSIQPLFQIWQMYGHHIWNFTAQMIAPSTSQPKDVVLCYEQLRGMLHLMPKVKTLAIHCNSSWISKDGNQVLEQVLQPGLFPDLIDLEHLVLMQVPVPVLDAFLRKYYKVTRLAIDDRHAKTSTLLCKRHLPNLSQLSLDLPNNESLVSLGKSTWLLKSLNIQIKNIKFDWQKLFLILETRLGTTLTELGIEVQSGQRKTPVQFLPCLSLPNLKVFELSSVHFVCLDFILPMSNSLEHLQLRYSSRADQEVELARNERVIKFYPFRKNLKESNKYLDVVSKIENFGIL